MIWLTAILFILAIFCAEYFRSRAVFWEAECRWWEKTATDLEKELKSMRPRNRNIVMFKGQVVD